MLQHRSLHPPIAHMQSGDCLEVLRETCPGERFDLIVTSPPYADRRANTYGGIKPERYVEWIEARELEIHDAWFNGGGGTAYVGWENASDCLMDGSTADDAVDRAILDEVFVAPAGVELCVVVVEFAVCE